MDTEFFRSFLHPVKGYRRWYRRRRLGAYAVDDEDERARLARRKDGQGSSCSAALVSSSSISAWATRVSAATSIDRAKT